MVKLFHFIFMSKEKFVKSKCVKTKNSKYQKMDWFLASDILNVSPSVSKLPKGSYLNRLDFENKQTFDWFDGKIKIEGKNLSKPWK